jgi:hypothetical protein
LEWDRYLGAEQDDDADQRKAPGEEVKEDVEAPNELGRALEHDQLVEGIWGVSLRHDATTRLTNEGFTSNTVSTRKSHHNIAAIGQ